MFYYLPKRFNSIHIIKKEIEQFPTSRVLPFPFLLISFHFHSFSSPSFPLAQLFPPLPERNISQNIPLLFLDSLCLNLLDSSRDERCEGREEGVDGPAGHANQLPAAVQAGQLDGGRGHAGHFPLRRPGNRQGQQRRLRHLETQQGGVLYYKSKL